MNDWNIDVSTLSPDKTPSCGTAGCIAGWVVADDIIQGMLSEGKDPFTGVCLLGNMGWGEIPAKATELLDLPISEGSKGDYGYSPLFDVDCWPEQFRGSTFYGVKGNPSPHTPNYAKVVIARIRHFIKTGE
jgi:hypothetical protein